VLYFGPNSLPKLGEAKEANMPKVVNCKDAGVECDFVIRGETEQEILQQAADHARTAHNMSEIPPEVAQKLRGAIRDEAA
jgi:predicted small metal-binding protein